MKRSPAFIAMQAALTVDLSPFHGLMAHTMLSGSRSGSFCGREIAPLGAFCHVALQLTPDGRPLLRTYSSGRGRDPDEFVIGTAAMNTTAYDLAGTRGQLFPTDNVALAAAVVRMLGDFPGGVNVDPKAGLQIPDIYVQFEPEQMRLPVPGRALSELMVCLRDGELEPAGLLAPCDGRVIGWTPDRYVPDFGWMVISDANGARHEVLLPTNIQPPVPLGDFVRKGDKLCDLTLSRVPNPVLEVIAWQAAKQTLPGYPGEFLPLLFALPVLRSGATPVQVLEDVRPLLGFAGVANPVNEIRRAADFHLPTSELGPRRSQVLTVARRELGELSVFATDADILKSMDNDSSVPLVLSGMLANQVWAASTPKQMQFRAPGLFVNLAGLRERWAHVLGPVDRVLPPAPAQEAKLLDAALQVSRQTGSASSAMSQVANRLPEVAGMTRLLERYGNDGSAQQYLEERRNALETTAP